MANQKTNLLKGTGHFGASSGGSCAPTVCCTGNGYVLSTGSENQIGNLIVGQGRYAKLTLIQGTNIRFTRNDYDDCGTGQSIDYSPCNKPFTMCEKRRSIIISEAGNYSAITTDAVGSVVLRMEEFHLPEGVNPFELMCACCDAGDPCAAAIPPVITYCPSISIIDGGFGFHQADPPDPAATVIINPCAGDVSVDNIYIYPTAGTGHTVRVTDCDGVLIGYAVNRSNCAPVSGQSSGANVVVNNQPPVNNITVTGGSGGSGFDTRVINLEFDEDDVLTLTNNDGTVIRTEANKC
jgi:hypothetical protein